MTFPKGKILGWYRVEQILGQGETEIVYCGFDTVLERTVAIKCFRPRRPDGSPEAEASAADETSQINLLFKEARLIGQLTHPHIAAIYDMGCFAGGTQADLFWGRLWRDGRRQLNAPFGDSGGVGANRNHRHFRGDFAPVQLSELSDAALFLRWTSTHVSWLA